MKIYRYAPDPRLRQFGVDDASAWWPRGVSMPSPVPAAYRHPENWEDRFVGYPYFLPIGDLPQHTLSHLAWSERANQALAGMSGIQAATTASFDGERVHVVQPALLEDAIDVDKSTTLTDQEGRPLALTSHVFREPKADLDIFWAGLMPFPEIYLSHRFVLACAASDLLGRDHFRLVWDKGPVGPSFTPPETTDPMCLDHPGINQEYRLLLLRAQWKALDWYGAIDTAQQATLALVREGWLPYKSSS